MFHTAIINTNNSGVNWIKKAPPKRGSLVLPSLLSPVSGCLSGPRNSYLLNAIGMPRRQVFEFVSLVWSHVVLERFSPLHRASP